MTSFIANTDPQELKPETVIKALQYFAKRDGHEIATDGNLNTETLEVIAAATQSLEEEASAISTTSMNQARDLYARLKALWLEATEAGLVMDNPNIPGLAAAFSGILKPQYADALQEAVMEELHGDDNDQE